MLVIPGLLAYALLVGARPGLFAPSLLLTLPYYLHPVELRDQEFSLSELAILAGGLGLAARAAWGWASASRSPSPRPPAWRELHPLQGSWADWIAAGFLGAGLLSLLATEYPKPSLRELRWLILEPVVVFYLVRLTARSPARVTWTLVALAGSGALAAIIAIADLARAGTLLDLSARATAPYLSPNHLGLFLERSAVAALALVLFTPGSGPQPAGVGNVGPGPRLAAGAGLASLGLGLLGLARSLSLGAWFGLGVAALALVWLRCRGWAIAVLLALLVGAGVALLVLPPERTVARLDPSTGTGLFRLHIWSSSLHMLADHPLLGVGLDNFLYLYRTHYLRPEAWAEPNISHPHNWLLHFWLQLGLPGAVVGTASAVWMGARALGRFQRPRLPSDRPLGGAALGLLLVFLVHGAVDNSYFLADLALVWWVTLGLVAERQPEQGESIG